MIRLRCYAIANAIWSRQVSPEAPPHHMHENKSHLMDQTVGESGPSLNSKSAQKHNTLLRHPKPKQEWPSHT